MEKTTAEIIFPLLRYIKQLLFDLYQISMMCGDLHHLSNKPAAALCGKNILQIY